MSVIQILLAAEAATTLRAVRSTAFRHRHLSARPLVVAAFNLSGEAAAPLGFCYGADRRAPKVVIAAEPRNRDSRFGAINAFAADLVTYIQPFLQLEEVETGWGKYTQRLAPDAPQIVVANRGTRDYLGARLGRSLRYLGLGETHAVPEATQWAGAHLSWLAEHAHHPGQSVFLAATELLDRHFVTGQSESREREPRLAARVDRQRIPSTGAPGSTRPRRTRPTAPCPTPNGRWISNPTSRHRTEHQRAGNAARMATAAAKVTAVVEPRLREAYEATWRALDRAREIPGAPSVPDRWKDDTRAWSAHARRAEHGIPRFARRHDALRAAHMLETWSRALERLAFQEAIDDPLVLAELDAAGRCVSGKVTKVDLTNDELKPGNKRKTQVPLVDVRLAGPSNLLVGDAVIWTGATSVEGELRSIDGTAAQIALMGGHKYGTRLPAQGATAVFAALSTFGGRSPDDPREVPWTHRAAEDPPAPAPTTGDLNDDDSPDLSAEALLALPLIGAVGPDAVPGVVL